jgi:hypothetical protein
MPVSPYDSSLKILDELQLVRRIYNTDYLAYLMFVHVGLMQPLSSQETVDMYLHVSSKGFVKKNSDIHAIKQSS